MRIILQAYDDYVSFDLQEGIEDIYKEQIKKFLTRDYLIHKETIEYWSLEDYDLKDSFVITPFIREIKLRMDINGE